VFDSEHHKLAIDCLKRHAYPEAHNAFLKAVKAEYTGKPGRAEKQYVLWAFEDFNDILDAIMSGEFVEGYHRRPDEPRR
jgi:hypothetical protein